MSETDQWLEYAGNDLRAADALLDASIYNQVCFHAQQCVEKVFKAGLIAQGDVYPRSHNLIALLNLLDKDTYAALFDLTDRLRLLDRFYMSTRYPDIVPGALPDRMPEREDAVEALDVARRIFAIMQGVLQQQ